MKMIERENKMVFVVSPSSSSQDVAKEFEKMFKVKVERVNTLRKNNGLKIAFIKVAKEYSAGDISVKLRIL